MRKALMAAGFTIFTLLAGVGAALAAGAPCTYDGKSNSSGARVCQEGKVSVCDNGQWDPTNEPCGGNRGGGGGNSTGGGGNSSGGGGKKSGGSKFDNK